MKGLGRMKPLHTSKERGQAKAEYALLLAIIVLVVVAVLLLLGPAIARTYQTAVAALFGAGAEQGISAPQGIMQDFLGRILAFYQAHGRWPRSWGDYRFTDLGLNPADWAGPVEGIYWNPNGSRVGLANRPGDNLQVYVTGLDGQRYKLYDGWNIWCVAESGQCYFHTVAPGNEVDISTLEVVEE